VQDQRVHFHFPFPSLLCIDSPRCHLSIHTFPLAPTSSTLLSFTLSAPHHHYLPPPPAPLPVFLSFCIAFPPSPSPSRCRSPNTLTLPQISVGGACIRTTPPALVECIQSSHRTSPILLFVFCSLPCTITPFPSTKRGRRSQIFLVLSPSLLTRLSHSQAVFRTPSLSPTKPSSVLALVSSCRSLVLRLFPFSPWVGILLIAATVNTAYTTKPSAPEGLLSRQKNQ
jgi:hypothetical protein